MDLSSLTDPGLVQMAIDECRRLGRSSFLTKYGFDRARKYFLVDGDELFDSKAILGAAFGFLDGRSLAADEFSGGDRSTVRVLRGLGYRVESPSDWLSMVTAEHVLAELAEFRRVGRDAYLGRYGGSESQKFFISDGGEVFDAKAVLVCAMRRASGLGGITHREVDGTEKEVADPLRKWGFTVVTYWPFASGEKLLRKRIHDLVGGSRQSGITRVASSADLLIFAVPKRFQDFGLGGLDGFQEDGSFWYSGEGTCGDQSLDTPGNAAILNADREGLRLRLFLSDDVMATYMGEMVTGDPAYEWRRALDAEGVERNVVVFQLVPAGQVVRDPALPPVMPTVNVWEPVDDSDFEVRGGVVNGRVVSRREMHLQNRFGRWLQASGRNVLRRALAVPSTNVVVYPDLYVESPAMVIEAKKSSSRGYVREAIGQVLDYQNLLRLSGEMEVEAAILLPARPDDDLVSLCGYLHIQVIFPEESGFTTLR